MCLDLTDPDPSLFVPVQVRIRILLSSSKNKKNLDFYCYATSLGIIIFEELCKCTFKKYRNKQKNTIIFYFFCILKVIHEKTGGGSVSQVCSLHKYMSILLGCDAALYREEARDPGQVREGGAQHHEAGEWRPAARQPGPARRRAHVLAPGGPYYCIAQNYCPGGPWPQAADCPATWAYPA
jgi:hypothetical protein